jgi:hypothetical protein
VSSIVTSLERLFESPVKIEERAREEKAARSEGESQPGDPPYQCRVCGFEGTDGSYCPTCLADTMVIRRT